MAVMRAVRLHFPTHELRIEEVDRPTPVRRGPGQGGSGRGVPVRRPPDLRKTRRQTRAVAGRHGDPGPRGGRHRRRAGFGRGRLGGRRPGRPPGRRVPRRQGLDPRCRLRRRLGRVRARPGRHAGRAPGLDPLRAGSGHPGRGLHPVGRHHRHRPRPPRPGGRGVGHRRSGRARGSAAAHGGRLPHHRRRPLPRRPRPRPGLRRRPRPRPGRPRSGRKGRRRHPRGGHRGSLRSGKPITIADSTTFSARELRLLGHYGSGENAVSQLIRLTENGRLDFSRSISDVLPLEQAAEAVERLEHKKGDPIRLVLRP